MRVINDVLDQHGRLDILVNNAGITADKTVRKMTVDDWDRVVQVNLSGAFYLSRAILQHMLDRGNGASSTSARSSASPATSGRRTTPPPRPGSSG